MHDVRVALGDHEIGQAHGVEFADAADVVAGEVDEHDVLGAFLRIGEQFRREPVVLLGRLAARTRARDGADLHLALLAADMQFRRRADERHAAELEDEHVGRRIDQPQRAVEIDRRMASNGTSKRCDGTTWKMSPARMYSCIASVIATYSSRVMLIDGSSGWTSVKTGSRRPGTARARRDSSSLDLGDGLVVGAIGVGRIGDVRVGDDFDPAFEVIENQQRVGDEEIGVGHVEVVLFRARHGRLELGDGLEAEIADRAAVEERQVSVGTGR